MPAGKIRDRLPPDGCDNIPLMNAEYGWLSKLFGCRASDNKEPLENFQTTLFAWMLSINEPFRQRVLKALFEEHSSLDFSDEHLEIETQYHAPCIISPRCVPDLCLRSRHFVAYVEHKVGSSFDRSQLDRYLVAIKSEEIDGKRLVAYIGRSLPQQCELPDRCATLTWEQVYNIAKEDKDAASSSPMREVLEFMKEHNMAEQKPLNIEQVKAIPIFREFMDSGSRLVDEVCIRVLPNVPGLKYGKPERDKRPSYYGRRLKHDRGHFGIYLYFPLGELSVLLYMTRPESDATDGENHQLRKCKAAGWRDLEENGYRGVALEQPLSPTWAAGLFPTEEFGKQVDWLAGWAIDELRKVLTP